METNNTKEKSSVIKNMEEYFKTHDSSFVAEDAIFKDMATGQETIGRKAIADMLHYIYHIAFDAKAVVGNTIITDDSALLEATFIGKHIGEFAGIPPTNNQVSVPLCVTYDLNKDGLIQKGRIYMLTDVMMQQLKAN